MLRHVAEQPPSAGPVVERYRTVGDDTGTKGNALPLGSASDRNRAGLETKAEMIGAITNLAGTDADVLAIGLPLPQRQSAGALVVQALQAAPYPARVYVQQANRTVCFTPTSDTAGLTAANAVLAGTDLAATFIALEGDTAAPTWQQTTSAAGGISAPFSAIVATRLPRLGLASLIDRTLGETEAAGTRVTIIVDQAAQNVKVWLGSVAAMNSRNISASVQLLAHFEVGM